MEVFWTWPARIYAGLTDDEIQALGYTDNIKDGTQLSMSFEDVARMFRRELAKHHNFLSTVGDATMTKWKNHLMILIGVTVCYF